MIIVKKAQNSDEWVETTLKVFNSAIDITKYLIEKGEIKDCIPSEYERESAINSLKSGRIVSTPYILFKLWKDIDTNVCSKCGSYYMGLGALSRKDNETEICSDCGIKEALEDM